MKFIKKCVTWGRNIFHIILPSLKRGLKLILSSWLKVTNQNVSLFFQVLFFLRHWLIPIGENLNYIMFFKLYLIDYAITVIPIFPLLPPSTQDPPLPQAIPTPLFTSMGHAFKFFGSSISYTLLYIPMDIL